jgi:hypothetical protein
MAHPFEHAESVPRNSAAEPRTTWRFITGWISPRPSSAISDIAHFGMNAEGNLRQFEGLVVVPG